MNRFEETPDTSNLINDAERELTQLTTYRGHEIGRYESDSELWNGLIVADKGHSAEGCEYRDFWDDDAGWVSCLDNKHRMFEIDNTQPAHEAMDQATAYIDYLMEKGS